MSGTELTSVKRKVDGQEVINILEELRSVLARMADPSKPPRPVPGATHTTKHGGVHLSYAVLGYPDHVVVFTLVNRENQQIRIDFDVHACLRIGPPYIMGMLEKIGASLDAHMQMRFDKMKSLIDIKTFAQAESTLATHQPPEPVAPPTPKLILAESVSKALN